MSTIRVLLVEDHTIVREGLRTLLSLEKDIEVVAEASDGAEAVRLVHDVELDVAVMDVAMPHLNGVDAARQMLQAVPEMAILALSVHRDRRLVMGMLAAGAKGYLLKNCPGEELAKAIRLVAKGQVYISAQISRIVAEDYVNRVQSAQHSSLLDLTPREREVLRLLARGKHSKEIAGELAVSPKTIDAHRQNVMKKLNAHSIADLTRFAIREGLVTLDE
jgi:DNA-binding NarL/FixJ family response regulator